MNINKYLDVNPEVAEAIANGKPVVTPITEEKN